MYSRIVAAIDGSVCSSAGARTALVLARQLGSEVVFCHVYAAALHGSRFSQMETGLPAEFQDEEHLQELRSAHDGLILNGLRSLSQGYTESLVREAVEAGIAVRERSVEGRNYVKLLEVAREDKADLLVVGARGLGALGEGDLGSTAARLMRLWCGDLLLSRRVPSADGPVLVGVDGSAAALAAVRRGVAWARRLERPLQLAAVYDPFFHSKVFRQLAGAMPQEKQDDIGLGQQEDLHDRIIHDGLGHLYQSFLVCAGDLAVRLGCTSEQVLLKGKPWQALVEHAVSVRAELLVMGRFGEHREEVSDIGSNAEAAARSSPGNVLLVAALPSDVAEADTPAAMEWDVDALARLRRMPGFAQPMARRGVEDFAREKGESRVTLTVFLQAGRRFGMESGEGSDDG